MSGRLGSSCSFSGLPFQGSLLCLLFGQSLFWRGSSKGVSRGSFSWGCFLSVLMPIQARPASLVPISSRDTRRNPLGTSKARHPFRLHDFLVCPYRTACASVSVGIFPRVISMKKQIIVVAIFAAVALVMVMLWFSFHPDM